MHYFKRNIGDYHKKAGRLTMLEHGAYTLLMDACYDREAFPTLQQALDWTGANTPEEIQSVHSVLSKFFTLKGGKTYVQSRIQEELAKYKERGKTNKEIADERERRKRERIVHESLTNGERTDHETAPNHKPLTISQEPLTNNRKPKTISTAPTADAVVATGKKSKGSQAWEAYSREYQTRYGVEPVRNAKVNSMMTQLVDRLGEDAPGVAAFFVHHNSGYYVSRGHAPGLLVADAEKLRTEWATGRSVTSIGARQLESKQANLDSHNEAIAILRAKGHDI